MNHNHNHMTTMKPGMMGDMMGDMMNMNDTDCSMPGMMMYFHTGTCEYVLFEKIIISNAGQMGGACVVIFFLAMLYEGLKCLREYLIQKNHVGTKYYNTTLPAGSSKENMVMESKETVHGKMLSGSHFLQTILHMVQVFVSYCLMLVFMTYNVWLGLAVILGAGAGYFFFGWKRAVVVDINEHCH
ncbi:high affinity copper uptake protein 1-like isoform X2 [Haliotis rubra]|uniref:high affinity copper uptake protein 1-like isoform X2 n=1 Tax=Haliotis rubra TaxID=36100 RepID=UPI001EE58437|nr:high affinity copper uptake protein 1-like isoform X2 [Haliotis rubra]